MAGPHNVVQVYLGWANSVFNERGIQIANLSELHNGHLLFELLAILAANRGHEREPRPSELDGKSTLEAVVETFRWLAVFGVKLSASASDVVSGSMKALLDVLWEMILHLTIHSPDRKPAQRTESIGAKLLMEWCSRMLADVTFDYRKSVAENINKEVLHRLINKCCDAASSSPKVHSSSFYTAVTEAESRLGVSSMLLRTSNDAAAGYGLMVYLALLRRKVELAACGRPLLKVDDYRKDAAQRAVADASMRQQLKHQQERTQQVLKDLENQLDSFKKLRQDSGIASHSKSSGDLSSTALCLDTSHDDDTLRASHASFDTALHDALSVDLSSSLVAQAVRSEAVHGSVSNGPSGHSSPAGDLAAVAGHMHHRTAASLSGMLQEEPSAAGSTARSELARHVRVHTTNGHCSTATAVAATAETHELSSGVGSAATPTELRSTRQSHRSANVPSSSLSSLSDKIAHSTLDVKSPTATGHGQTSLLHGATATVRVGKTPSCADAFDGPCQLARDSHTAVGSGDADSASCTAGHPVPSGALTTTGSQKEAARVLPLLSMACASGEDAADDDSAAPDGTTVHPRDDRRSQSSDYHPMGCDIRAGGGGSYEAPDLLFSLLVSDVGQLPGLPRLESTTYAESEDFVLAWLTSTPDDGIHYELPNRGSGDYGECGTLVDDNLMTALDKIGRRNEAMLAQLHDARRREIELLRRLAERDDLVLRLHRSLLLLSSSPSSPQVGNEGPPPGALPAPSDGLPTSAAVSPVAAAAGSAQQGAHGECVEDDHNDGLDGELEQYKQAVKHLHDELARCRFKVVAPLQDENRLLHKRLHLQEEQHLETCRALQDERVAQERLIVNLQLEMARFDRLLAGSSGRHDRWLSPGAVDAAYSSGRDRKPARRHGARTKGVSASSSVAAADSVLGRRVSSDSQQPPSPAPIILQPVALAAAGIATDAKTGSIVMSRRSERSSVSTDLASGRRQASGACHSQADGCNDDDDAASAGGTHTVYLKPDSSSSSCLTRIGCSTSVGEMTGLSRTVNGDVMVPASKCKSAGDSLAVAAGSCPPVEADWQESVLQELARVRAVFGAAAHVDDITIVRAAFNLLNESISQHVASPGSGGAAAAGEGREHVVDTADGFGGSSSSKVGHQSPATMVAGASRSGCLDMDDQRQQGHEEVIGHLQHEVDYLRQLVDSLRQSGHNADDPTSVTAEWTHAAGSHGGRGKAPYVAPSAHSSAADATSLSSSPGSSSLLAQDATSYSTLEAARTEVERLRLKEQAMNHEFASKIAIMDNLLRTKIEEVHILQDANLVLASQRDRYAMQHRQSEQECEALRSLLKQHDDRARHSAAAAALTASADLLPASEADEDRAVASVLAMTADVAGGHGGIDSHCVETATAAQLGKSASLRGGGKLTGNNCSSPMPSDPVPDQPVMGSATAANVAELVLPTGHVECELPMGDLGAGTPRALSPKSSSPVLNGLDEPHRAPAAVPRSRPASPDMTSVDMNDAIINELAALNMVTTDKWMLPRSRPGNGAVSSSIVKASAAVVSRADRFLGAGEHRRPAYKGAAGKADGGGVHELGSRALAPATATKTTSSVTASRFVSGVTPSRQSAGVDSMRSSKFDSESSKVKPRLPATVKRTTVKEAAPSSRSGAGSAFRRYEDGGPSPPALFPVLMEPSRRSRKP